MSLFYTRLYFVFISLFISISICHGQFTGGDSDGSANVRYMNTPCTVSSLNAFAGGNSDGNSNVRVTNVVCSVTNLNAFAGGFSDGHSNVRIVNSACAINTMNPFSGGISDGHANARVVNTICTITTFNPFAGGISDGHSNVRVINSVCSVNTINPFAGGISDGHSNVRVINSVCSVNTINPFAGGVSDGHANLRIINTFCSVATTNPFAGGISDGHSNARIINLTAGECIPTPIDLISFTANCNYPLVLLDWVTALEKNNDYFIVERNVEGGETVIVGTVKGKGNSTQLQSYKFEDNISTLHTDDKMYYRLKQVDYNGSYEYSSIIKLNNCSDVFDGFQVFPNPTNGSLVLNYRGDKEKVKSIEVLNALGSQVKVYEEYTPIIHLSSLESGMYFIYLYLETTFFVEKVFLEK